MNWHSAFSSVSLWCAILLKHNSQSKSYFSSPSDSSINAQFHAINTLVFKIPWCGRSNCFFQQLPPPCSRIMCPHWFSCDMPSASREEDVYTSHWLWLVHGICFGQWDVSGWDCVVGQELLHFCFLLWEQHIPDRCHTFSLGPRMIVHVDLSWVLTATANTQTMRKDMYGYKVPEIFGIFVTMVYAD